MSYLSVSTEPELVGPSVSALEDLGSWTLGGGPRGEGNGVLGPVSLRAGRDGGTGRKGSRCLGGSISKANPWSTTRWRVEVPRAPGPGRGRVGSFDLPT